MHVVKKINGLNGSQISRADLHALFVEAKQNDQTELAARLEAILMQYPDAYFDISIHQPFFEETPDYILQNLPYEETPDEKYTGLNKAVSPDEIYQYITDLVINTIKEVGHLPWQREWEKTSLFNGWQALNYDSKKGYRGINFVLTNFEVKMTEEGPALFPRDLTNPYFLTFKQIEKHGGKLKKGSKGVRVVYFTKLYQHEERDPKTGKIILEFGTYDQKKFIAWLKENRSKIRYIKNDEDLARLANSYIPILKYYNVYAGEDVEGIDWGLMPKNENVDKPERERIEIAEAIVKAMPQPPKFIFGGDQPAYSPGSDHIRMTPIEAFNNEQSYYSTLFHEMIHSTGHKSRLNRFGLFDGKKEYAFEELIAELGAVFLCAESGILFSTLENSAKYLQGWNSRLVDNLKNDNRFFFRAASKSQAASDYILDRDKDGNPAYLKNLIIKPAKIEKPKPAKVKKPKPEQKAKPEKPKFNPSKLLANQEVGKTDRAAIKDVLSTKKYKISQAEALLIWKYFKNATDADFKDYSFPNLDIFSKKEHEILRKKESSLYDYEPYLEEGNPPKDGINEFGVFALNESALALIESIKGRKKSLDNQKNNLALFPGLKKPKSSNKVKPKPKKKSSNSNKGLKNPAPAPVEREPVNPEPLPVANRGRNTVASNLNRRQSLNPEFYKMPDKDIAEFLDLIEIKPRESVVITIAGEKGSSKTHGIFKWINAFAQNYNVGHASLEEDPGSYLYEQKAKQYFNPRALATVEAPYITSIDQLDELVKNNDVIFIDSFAKLQEMAPGFGVDKDLRKKYDGKLFVVIFQQTSNGKMRGGSKSEYDGDIILYTEKHSDFKENYIWTDKNRYTRKPIDGLRYYIYTGNTVYADDLENTPEPAENEAALAPQPAGSFEPKGTLIIYE